MAKIIIEVCWDKSFTEKLIKRNYDVGSMFDTAIRMGLQKAVVVSNEQDIVKPYLDKLRAEIRKKMKFNSFNEGYVLYDDIAGVLDKYKESEE